MFGKITKAKYVNGWVDGFSYVAVDKLGNCMRMNGLDSS